MALFPPAIANTELWEGGYVNNPLDSGGETYRGISRNNWGAWEGWMRIDLAKCLANFPKSLDTNSILQGMVVSFYQTNFWVYGEIDAQVIANKIFDLAVNVGKVHANKIAQIAVDVDPDGFFGPQTIIAINSTSSGSLLPKIISAAEEYHKAIVESHPQDAIFLKGWLRRDSA